MVCVNGKMQRLIWSGLSDPDVGEIINMSFRSIFHIPGTATSGRRKGRHWDPTKRAHQPKKHDLPKWTGEMWSLYWFLVGSPFPVLDSILWNMAVTDPNTKQGLDPISIPVKDKDGEFEVKELKTAQAMPYQILPKPFPNPSHDLIAAEDLQILKMAVDASGYQDKLFLGLVVEHIWSWRPSEDQPTWKAEICAEDLISCFPSETQEQLKSRIYKISALYFPKLGADYLLRKLLDGLPKHLHALAKDIWESPKTNRDERIAAFVKKTGLSQETIENMLRELQSFRADWAIRCLPDELKERLAPLFEI